jgi:pimeloyl-ACP methyl ester carboxylesterase/chloramphenicol 3-O-phosphotransferase
MFDLKLVLIFALMLVMSGCTDRKENNMRGNKSHTGQVIVFDGASSAGKSSIIKNLMPMLDSTYEYIAVDDFVSAVFLEQQKLNLPEKEFLNRVNQQTDIMYDKIKLLISHGKNVILDTVLSGLEGEKSIKEQLDKLKIFSTIKILVYCPLPVLLDRIKQRNERAHIENKPEDERSIGTAINQFGHIYKKITDAKESSLCTISRKYIELACETCKREFAKNLSRFDQFKEWLFSQLGTQDENEVMLTTRLKYDCVVDTSKNTPEECANKIRLLLCSKTISTSTGISLYTEFFGNSKNPAVLLISGAMAPSRFWIDDFCQQLSNAGYFVIRYDHRDMGLSSAIDYSKNPYTLKDLAADATAILDAYDIKKAHIVGHSMGGAIAQLLALDHPSRVNSMTLISSSVLANPELNSQEKASLEKTWQEMMKNKPTKKFEQSLDGFMNSFKYLHGTIPMDNEIAQQYIKDMYERTLPEHLEWFEKFSAGIELLHNHVKAQQNLPDRTKELKNIKIPTLIIHGQTDCLALPRIAKEYCADMIPDARMQVIPGMGHMILSGDLFTQIKDLILKYIDKGEILNL